MNTAIAGNLTEAAARYGASRWTAQAWIRMGMPFVKTGRKSKIIIFSAMDKWMESRQISLGRKP